MKILLVDDDQYNREYLQQFMERLGHQVTVARDGKEALELFFINKYHMVLSDIRMPRLSGIKLLQSIQNLGQGSMTLVVLFTAHSDVSTAIDALRAGAYDYLIKPINIRELVALLNRAEEYNAIKLENEFLTNKFESAVQAATEQTREELSQLKKAYLQSVGLDQMGVFSPAMRQVMEQGRMLHSDRSISVLIEGETGTGKELVARFIHFGEGVSAPFVDINCATLTPNLFESELFGYEGGAFSGSLPGGQKGKLEMAEGGSLFLDEIAEIPVGLQAKLLRVIQEKSFYKVGGPKKTNIDVRFICATNVNLREAVSKGSFRSDLYYRLNTGYIYILPLRERPDDILPLAIRFLTDFARKKKKRFQTISKGAADMLMTYSWPGNVRELKNLMERIVLMEDDTELKAHHLKMPQNIQGRQSCADADVLDFKEFSLPDAGFSLEQFNKHIIAKALQMHGGNVTRTAQYLGISRRSLSYRLKRM